MSRFRLALPGAAFLALLFLAATDPAFAQTAPTDATDAWSGPLDQLTKMLTGAPARVISIIAIVVAGIALIFGEDLGAFAKRLLMVVIATAMIVGSSSIITALNFSTFQGLK